MISAPLSHPKPTSLEDLPQRHENFIPFQKKRIRLSVCSALRKQLYFSFTSLLLKNQEPALRL